MWDIILHIRRIVKYRSHYFIPSHQLIIQYITGHKGTRFEKLDILQIYQKLKPKIYRFQILSSLELYRIGTNYHLM